MTEKTIKTQKPGRDGGGIPTGHAYTKATPHCFLFWGVGKMPQEA